MALIGSVNNQGSIQGQINEANGNLTGVISNVGLIGGQVVGMRGLKGDKGDAGDDGSGIASIEKTGTVGLVDTYTITFDDGDTTTFEVTNGQDGVDGIDGDDGADGFSPIATVTKSGDTATISITDANSTTTATVTDGADGTNGADGHSPVVTASKAGKVTTVSVDGSPIATINDGNDGTNGTNGQDGHSPVVTASKAGKVTTISVDGTPIATINDGQDGVVEDVTVNGTSVLDGATAKVLVPTDTGDLTNGAGYLDKSGILDLFYPVGSYYETSDTSFDPNVAWGGTWIPETEGLVHIGAGLNYTAGDTGGSKDAIIPYHKHTQDGHSHGSAASGFAFQLYKSGSASRRQVGSSGTNRGYTFTTDSTSSPDAITGNGYTDTKTPTINYTGKNADGTTPTADNTANANMQPYIVVNRWHRTA